MKKYYLQRVGEGYKSPEITGYLLARVIQFILSKITGFDYRICSHEE